jgi:hypothetical protein
MSAANRLKGQRGEREAFALLSDELGFVVTRNVDQARKGGADSLELVGFAPEIKRCERLCKPAWWRQAVKQGRSLNREPIVWFRQSRKPWRALIASGDGFREVSWEESIEHVREKLTRLYAIYPEAT